MNPNTTGLQLQGVGKRFGDVRVVQELDLTVHQGEFVVLLGESGCGKSTTLRMIAGLEEVSEGQIFINGKDVTMQPPKARDIAMVFQNYALYPHMDVAQNMSFALELAGTSKTEIARPKSCRAGSASGWRLAARLCANQRYSCLMNHSRTSMRNYAAICALSWRCCTNAWAKPRFM
jgi:ABC-type sugar transport system ATPase subunit